MTRQDKDRYSERRELELLATRSQPFKKSLIAKMLSWSITTVDEKTKTLRKDGHLIIPTPNGIWLCQKVENIEEYNVLLGAAKTLAIQRTALRELSQMTTQAITSTPKRWQKQLVEN